LRNVALRLVGRETLDVAVERYRRTRISRLEQGPEPGRRHDEARGARKAGGEQLTARDRPPVVLVQQRLTRGVCTGRLLSNEHGVDLLVPGYFKVRAAL